jgi:hypothetical protein
MSGVYFNGIQLAKLGLLTDITSLIYINVRLLKALAIFNLIRFCTNCLIELIEIIDKECGTICSHGNADQLKRHAPFELGKYLIDKELQHY